METLIFTASAQFQAVCHATLPVTGGGSWLPDQLICVPRFLGVGRSSVHTGEIEPL